jgi:biotin carboxyl carrier protein
MKYSVEVDGRRLTVELDGPDVVVDGVRLAASLETIDGTPVRRLRVGDRVRRVVATRTGGRGEYRVTLDGWQLPVSALDARTRAIRDVAAASAASSGPAPLVAPMPGLVVRVLVEAGVEVTAGQALVVIEAMKMENELRAAGAGRVTAVHAVAGTAVEKGAVLVELGTA